MKYKVGAVLWMVLMAFSLNGQQEYDQAINASFEEYREAFLKTDRLRLTEMAHPEIVEKGGGEVYYYEMLTEEYNMFASGGMKIKDLQSKQASKVLEAGDHLQAMLPYELTLGTAEKDYVQKNYFLITSIDGGETWYFTDMFKYDAESITQFLSNYNTRLNFYLRDKE